MKLDRMMIFFLLVISKTFCWYSGDLFFYNLFMYQIPGGQNMEAF